MNKGLTSKEAQEQLKKFGANRLPQKQNTSLLKLFLNQIQNPFFYLLIAAVGLSLAIGDILDGFLIAAILVLNLVLGFWQEYKASKELETLVKLQVEFVRCLRDGKQIEIPSSQIVPGDVVVLESGDKVPADAEIIESYSLQVNESVLTGESLPVMKSGKHGENEVFFATTVTSGRGKVLVKQTGLLTKFGKIAQSLASIEDDRTPLEKSLASLSKAVGFGAIAIAVLVFVLRALQGFEISESLLGSIALMVAVVPEGLPTVLTLVLALGVRKMYQKRALVRKMIAVETLGAATVILTDKTGTLTKNEMRVKQISNNGLNSQKELLRCAVLCNSADLVLKEDSRGFDILGDTTEGALLIWAKEQGTDIDFLRSESKLLEEIPFDLKTRKMTVVCEYAGKKIKYCKGAPEVMLLSSDVPEKDMQKWEIKYQQMAKKGLRVLGFSKDDKFLGFVGIADEVRSEVKESIRIAFQAGIKVVMVTGDNELTARAIGEEIGLLQEGDEILTGVQLEEENDEDLLKRIKNVKIFARIQPEGKLKIVKAYQSLGEVVAVTGDGVNDVLALKQADIGVSMGKIGTDTSKEASDIVLLDDNFATLVTAVEQGRLIYSNIVKVVKFLLTGNLAESLLIGLVAILGSPTPLLPTQILWINFVSDGLPALSLGFDSPSHQVMKNPPRKSTNLLGKTSLVTILVGGLSIALVCLGVFYFALNYYGLQTARNVVFSVMVVCQMILPFAIRRHHKILSNKKLLATVIFILLMQFAILTFPPLRMLFKI